MSIIPLLGVLSSYVSDGSLDDTYCLGMLSDWVRYLLIFVIPLLGVLSPDGK